MHVTEVILLAIALSMDAAAVGMTDGMTEPKMPVKRAVFIAALFGLFQALMPLIGYFVTELVTGAFVGVFERASAWISFGLLAFIGGKMIFDGVKPKVCDVATKTCPPEQASIGKLVLQAIATSIDALAIGVTLRLAAISPAGLSPAIGWSVAIIGGITFALSTGAVFIGKLIGDKLADKAELIGGIVLVGIGLKILIESFL